MSERSCAACSNPLVKKPGPGGWPKYCSDECRPLNVRRAAASHTASKADGRYEARKAAARKKRAEARPPCLYCSAPCSRKVCSAPECRKAFNRERMRAYTRAKADEYRARGESYALRWRTPGQVAENLRKLEANRDPAKAAAARQANWHRRRAQKLQAPTENFRHQDIYDRDGWICGLCAEPVDPGRAWPHPKSPSLDHIVPLSLGGHHTRENVQLAHLDCNVRKGARAA